MGNAVVKTQFFTFDQNNSGGSFSYDEGRGIGQYVIVEAIDRDHAVTRAEQVGLYFNGYGDCECCGDRWYKPWDKDGTETPQIYDQTPDEYLTSPYCSDWGMDKQVFVHYLSGQILAYGKGTGQVQVSAGSEGRVLEGEVVE